MERLTENSGKGWVLKLDNPQDIYQAKQQLFEKFKLACNKLAQLEDLMEKYGIQRVEDLDWFITQKIKKEKRLRELEKALELACEEVPVRCSDTPERYNLQDEYGSDEPYWVEEGGCEFSNHANCLECTINYFKNKAKSILETD